MLKLRNVLTRRVLKLLDDEARKDPEKYIKWYQDFSIFLKEGISADHENSEILIKLLRFNSTYSKDKVITLDDYITKMKAGQEKIYFISHGSIEGAIASPFMEPLKGTNIPVLILTNNVDELCL